MFSIDALGFEVHLSTEQTLIIAVLMAAACGFAERLFCKKNKSVTSSSKLEVSVGQDVLFESNRLHAGVLLLKGEQFFLGDR